MEVIYGPGLASNILLTAQKRLVRPVYAQTEGFPYAAVLDPSLRDTTGNIRIPRNLDTAGQTTTGSYPVAAAAFPLTRSADAYNYQNSLIPGAVLVKSGNSEYACFASGANAAEQPWGLLGQWIGGTFDNVGQTNQIGVWAGPDSVYDLLAPAWDYTSISTAMTNQTAGSQVNLYAGTNSVLYYSSVGSAGSRIAVARAIQMLNASVLRIQMLI